MRGYFSIFLLFFLFIAIAILSGYKSKNSSSGCNSPPAIIVSKPVENDNIEKPPVSVEFEAIQKSTDLTSIDLSKVSAVIRDNVNAGFLPGTYFLQDLLLVNFLTITILGTIFVIGTVVPHCRIC